ncbi:class I SAM-dependent methyltransferase [Bradyrhizobium sp. CCGUVB1N3]|uniref:class I SAM-dependent methyltransferase n=1 Tax=Bradyrhizobium sp. CCGUVB1N3 TaxID=2949629 RepID=UPI0020B1C235|nr:class I SAM-dependent methyltransferase [Bradyrhizobium sp. CCGUVB1N3]MCP3471858.1 class I SAM-dependent methyltransferase [Bradyrhizobium sp. CCGUVB1N3]
MGRFATTASLYELLRPPYPPEFFRSVAQRLALAERSALIDLGTGPGLLALGFAPYVGRIVGVDPEPDMLDAARRSAARTGRDLRLIESKAEMLPSDIGTFDLVTIGRALHWMDRAPTLALLERLVAQDGAIAICASFSTPDNRNPWLDDYNAARCNWSPAKLWEEAGRGERTHRDLPAFFRGSTFQVADVIKVETRHEISVRDLARRVLTFSSSSPEAVGDNVEAMLRDVEKRLAPFSRDGVITETLLSVAEIVRP